MVPIHTALPVHRPLPRKCPECREPEHIVEVCGHCGHRYPPADNPSFWAVIAGLLVMLVVVPLLLTVGVTFFGPGVDKLLDKVECASPWRDKDRDYFKGCNQ